MLRAADPHPPAPSPIKREGEQNAMGRKEFWVGGGIVSQVSTVFALHETSNL